MSQQPPSSAEFGTLIEGHCIHGDAKHSLRCGLVMPLARAFGDLLAGKDGTFAIGYDVRDSSASLAEAASLGLRSGGHHVIHIGACTTPQLEWYVAEAGLHGGIMIAGGCAPPEHNGIRFYGRAATPVTASQTLDALTIVDLNELFADACNPVLRQDAPIGDYTAWLRQRLHPQRNLKICLDTGNGLTGAEFEAVMVHYRQLRLWRIGFKPDPAFATRGPDPFSAAARERVAQCVSANGCHFGAALDADGDRLAVIDERGHTLAPDELGAILALGMSEQHPRRLRVLHDPQVGTAVLHTLTRAGIAAEPLAGGPIAAHPYLHDERADFYFDHTGHYVFSDFPGTSNALLTLIELINRLTATEMPLSALSAAVHHGSAA